MSIIERITELSNERQAMSLNYEVLDRYAANERRNRIHEIAELLSVLWEYRRAEMSNASISSKRFLTQGYRQKS